MFPLLVVLSLLELGSGYVLGSFESVFVEKPAMLVLVPVVIGMGGNLGSVLSSRLSTGLHLGTVEFSLRDTEIWANCVAVLGLAATVFTLLGFAAYAVASFTGSPLPVTQVVYVSVVSGLSLAVVVVAVSIAATYASYRFGYDPDDVVIPVVTNICDILGVVILTAVVVLGL